MILERADETLTVDEAFDAMRFFIEAWWERGGRESEDAHWLTSAMSRELTNDRGPADQAMWTDFLAALDRAKKVRQ